MNEGKKDRRDPIRTVKPRNFVAKNAGATTSGAGAHKDRKKASTEVRGAKHKKQDYAEHLESLYANTLNENQDVCRVCGCTPCNCTHVVSENFDAEYDDEAGMADNNLETLERAVQGIDELISAGDNLPEWCQEKIAVAKSMLVAVWDYMRSEEDSIGEGWGAERQQRELDASNAKWREMLAKYENDPKMSEYLKMFRVSNWTPEKAEAGAKEWIAKGKPLPSWYTNPKSVQGYKISEKSVGEDQGIDDIIAWKLAVKKAYPQFADKMRFKGLGSQISAELPGVDRSFGVFDLETGTGQVLDEGKIYFEKLSSSLAEQLKKR